MFDYIINAFFFIFLFLGTATFLYEWVPVNFRDGKLGWTFLFREARGNFWMLMFLAVIGAKLLHKADTIILLLEQLL